MTDLTAGSPTVDQIRDDYTAMTRRKRVYGGILLILFVAVMASGFRVADDRNAGSFRDGWTRIFDYPAEVLAEAWEKIGALPENLAKFFPALIETLNIAAASTLIGAIAGTFLALMSTRGMALWPALIPLFRRIADVCRAVPEIVIALVLIFILGGGPVPAMIAIAIHTAGALGKLFFRGQRKRLAQAGRGPALGGCELVATHVSGRDPTGRTELCQLRVAAVRNQYSRLSHPGFCWRWWSGL